MTPNRYSLTSNLDEGIIPDLHEVIVKEQKHAMQMLIWHMTSGLVGQTIARDTHKFGVLEIVELLEECMGKTERQLKVDSEARIWPS